ncbi:MAG TPA: hypothetical protein VK964_19735 [Nocardioidaceae bacterium]|nr:hypothetical protein [Nocardioidaceae bacterium]
MDPRRIASIAAVLGGIGWLAKVGLIWLEGGETDSVLVTILDVAGWALFAVALAAAGYTLVERAPVWLRAVVAVATPLLVLMVWMLLDQGIKGVYPGESWLRDEVSVLVAALIAIVLGFWGFGRHRPEPPAGGRRNPPARGRRAAR